MKLIVNPHNIEILKEPVNEREIDITKIQFEFADEITNDYVKEAYFTFKGTSYKVIITNNECQIPSEVLTEKGQVEIGVVAFLVENEQEIKRYNPSPAYFNTWDGSLKDNPENSEPITPSEMEQYEQALQDGLEEVNDKLDDIDQALSDVNTAITETNNLDLDVSKEGKVATVTLTKKDATTKVVTLSDGTNLMFNWQGTSLGIKTDEDADYTYVDLQGVQGETGPMGAPFTIKKTYSSVAEMNADFNNMQVGDYVMITSTVEVEDNAKLYCKGEEQWIFITDFSGATGIQGETGLTPNIQIGTVTSGNAPAVTRTGTNENPVLNFVLEKGEQGIQGIQGETGNGIASVTKTATAGLIDTYTITFTDNTTTTFTVTNGEVSQEQLDYVKKYSNALIKQNSSGTDLTINDTAECPMPIELSPSELSQATTTGKNLFNKNGSFDNIGTSVSVLNTGIKVTQTVASNYRHAKYLLGADELLDKNITITANILPSGSNVGLIRLYFGSAESESIQLIGALTQTGSETLTIASTFPTNADRIYLLLYTNTNTTQNINDYVDYTDLQVEIGSTATSYEPYTGLKASPNPDYPQDIHVITGSNAISIINSNLFDGEMELGIINGTTGKNSANNDYIRCKNYIKVNELTNYRITSPDINSRVLVYEYKGDYSYNLSTNKILEQNEVLTTNANTQYIRFRPTQISEPDTSLRFMINAGDKALPYKKQNKQNISIDLGAINIFDKNTATYRDEYIKNDNGVETTSSVSGYINSYVEVKPNTKYTINGDITDSNTYWRVYFYDSSKNWISRTSQLNLKSIPYTFTTPNNCYYIQFQYKISTYDANTIQIEKGEIAGAYAPYGQPSLEYCKIGNYSDVFFKNTINSEYYDSTLQLNKWYLKKNINKIILNGSESWTLSGTNNVFYMVFDKEQYIATNNIPKSNYFSGANNVGSASTMGAKPLNSLALGGASLPRLYIKTDVVSTKDALIIWLSNNNTIVYYQLETPTNILLNETLQAELEQIYNWLLSYQDQTNISQTNYDLPFVISTNTIKDLSNIEEGITIEDVEEITGELENLNTTDKTNLVSAINEVASSSGGGEWDSSLTKIYYYKSSNVMVSTTQFDSSASSWCQKIINDYFNGIPTGLIIHDYDDDSLLFTFDLFGNNKLRSRPYYFNLNNNSLYRGFIVIEFNSSTHVYSRITISWSKLQTYAIAT